MRFAMGIGLVAMLLAAPASADQIRAGGTGSGVGTLRLLGDAFEKANPQHRVEVMPALGSSGGLRALRAGQLQVAVTNREPNAEERSGLQFRRYASTPLALVTHDGVPPTAMTRERLALLLSGREVRWPNGQAVRLVLRPASDGDSKLLAKLSPTVEAALNEAHSRPGMVVAQTDSEAADYVERTPNAIGAVAVAQASSEQRKLRILSLDGVAATPAMLEAGRYPLTKEMFLVIRSDANEGTRAFFTFVTESSEARSILRRHGHVAR